MRAVTVSEFQSRRGRSGQSIVEVVAGLCIFIPIMLALLDLAMVVVASTTAQNLTYQAARAAASLNVNVAADGSVTEGTNPVGVQATINNILGQTPLFGGTSSFTFSYPSAGYGTGSGVGTTFTKQPEILVKGTLNYTLPVPVPFFNLTKVTFATQSTCPVVSVPPPPAT